jgi:hypothetical protein
MGRSTPIKDKTGPLQNKTPNLEVRCFLSGFRSAVSGLHRYFLQFIYFFLCIYFSQTSIKSFENGSYSMCRDKHGWCTRYKDTRIDGICQMT